MKKSTTIPYIPSLAALAAEDIKAALRAHGTRVAIDCCNWAAEFPYAPKVEAFVAHSGSHIALLFEVTEEHTKAIELSNNGRVWEDSCVEFFVENPTGAGYYNFELNAIGSLLAARRASREDAVHFSEAELLQVVRYTKYDHSQIDICGENSWWALELIPFSSLGVTTAPETLRANLYKCGDNLNRPHFLSWSPITLKKPNFHCPDYFGTLIFEKYE